MDDQLRSAVHKNDVKALQALVEAGADVNARDEWRRTPLFWAIEENSLAAAEVLIKAGADVTIHDNDGLSTLDLARSPEMRQLLARAWPQDHSLRLHALFKADLADEVADAAAAGADVNARDEQGRTPLLWAIQKSSLAVAEVLINAGAGVTVCDSYGQSTMYLARSPEMRQLLIRAWPQDHPLRLHALADADLADEVVDAVAAGADVNARDEQGQTPLFWASQKNSLAVAEVLINAGADVTVCDSYGQSTLYLAKSPEMRQLLARVWPQDHLLRLHALADADLADEVANAVAAGADVNARDGWRRTPLFWAIEKDSLAAAEVLVEAGADVTVCDNDGRSTLDLTRTTKIRQLLVRAWPQDDPR